MAENATKTGAYTLWGVAHSYYTGKIRSYLIKKGVPFRELYPSNPGFQTRILPAVRHMVVPIMETPEGEIIQDTTDMIECLEARFPQPPLVPDTPVQRAVAWLLGAFGSEGLLQPGMSYRWSYRDEQEDFLRCEFGRIMYAGPDREARNEAGRQLMDYFNDFLPRLGVTPETISTIEAAYCELLANATCFNAWVAGSPSLPAGQPVSADGERKVHPTLGYIDYPWRGCTMHRDSLPHGLWHFDRAAAHARALGGEPQQRFDVLVQRCGGQQVMAIELARPMKREDYVLVLA